MQTDGAKPWRKVENWRLVLPNLGRSVSLPVLMSEGMQPSTALRTVTDFHSLPLAEWMV